MKNYETWRIPCIAQKYPLWVIRRYLVSVHGLLLILGERSGLSTDGTKKLSNKRRIHQYVSIVRRWLFRSICAKYTRSFLQREHVRYLFSMWITSVLCLLNACTPVKSNIENQYKIIAFSATPATHPAHSKSILISQSDAISGYQTEQMLYTDTLYQLNAFAHSAWISPPANMLTPLIVQSLQHSHYFHAVAAGPNADKTDYRLDTQLIGLQQNFLTKPSTLEFSAQVVLTRVGDNHVVASRTFMEHLPCPTDTPYGGVIAANRATQAFTAKLAKYVIQHVEQDT